MGQVSSLIAWKLETMASAGDRDLILSKDQAICALLPYAISLEKGGQHGMVTAIMRAARASASRSFMDPIGPCVSMLFQTSSSPSLNRIIILLSPYIRWEVMVHGEGAVVRWAAAALAVPDTVEVCQSVVDALLQIASIESLRPHIPIEIWAWMKKRPFLPPVCWGRCWGTTPRVVRHVRGLGDFEILKSYFLLVWSEWDSLYGVDLSEMKTSIKEEFGGIGMRDHRQDLIKRLGHILGQLDQQSDHLTRHNPRLNDKLIRLAKRNYQELEGVLVVVDRETMDTLIRASLKLIIFHQVCGY